MRRFITTLSGRLLSHAVAGSLLLPFLTFGLLSSASAQFAQLPSWAVVEFINDKGGGDYGKTAADAVTNELIKTTKYEVTPEETVDRTADGLGLQMPLVGMVSLLRLGQELKADSIVSGEIFNYRVVPGPNGTKHADVIMRVIVTDVASGLTANGAALIAHSTDRAANVPDQTLINEAIAAGANSAVNVIQSQTLPTGTLLNTVADSALVNQGTRVGFANGQNVVVLRGHEQVATATVYDVEPDSAYIKIKHSIKGLQPGDLVRVIFSVPDIDSRWPKDMNANSPIERPSKARPSSTGFVQVLLLLGLVAALFGQGRAGNDNVFTNVTAEAGSFVGNQQSPDPASGVPGVLISWRTDFFIKGNQEKLQYQIFRESPVEQIAMVSPGSTTSAVDTSAGITLANVFDFLGQIGGNSCVYPVTAAPFPSPPLAAIPNPVVLGVSPGQPYTYGVELVYELSSLDLPIQPPTVTNCLFVTQRAFSTGTATPLSPPQLTSPNDNAVITGPLTFAFNSVQNTTFPITVDYAVELSTVTTFASGKTIIAGQFTRNSAGSLATPTQIDTGPNGTLPAFIKNAQTLYWRIGARNDADRPGPLPDANGQRYIFSGFRTLTRQLVPPGGP